MGKDKKIRVRAARRAEPDVRRMSRAIIEMVMAEAEVAAQAEYEQRQQKNVVTPKGPRP